MFNLLDQLKKPIAIQIDNYHAWKSIRYPTAAVLHKRILKEFSNRYKFNNVRDIEYESVQDFIWLQNSIYFKKSYAQALKSFFDYCRMMGYVEIKLAPLTLEGTLTGMSKIGPLVHTEQVKRVQELRQKGLSFRKIKTLMETEDKKPYHLRQIHRWGQYELSTGTS